MAAQVITTDELREFKTELLQEINAIFNKHQSATQKKWLKSPEVRKLLGISPGTLQNLRVNGTLPFTKIGGVIFYDYDLIQKVLCSKK